MTLFLPCASGQFGLTRIQLIIAALFSNQIVVVAALDDHALPSTIMAWELRTVLSR